MGYLELQQKKRYKLFSKFNFLFCLRNYEVFNAMLVYNIQKSILYWIKDLEDIIYN